MPRGLRFKGLSLMLLLAWSGPPSWAETPSAPDALPPEVQAELERLTRRVQELEQRLAEERARREALAERAEALFQTLRDIHRQLQRDLR